MNVLRDLKKLGARVSVISRSEETARRARAGGADRVVRSIDDVERADGVVIVTPTPHHADAIRASAGLGCPIFCEKPLVADPADEEPLLELCGERLFVMHKWRWHPGIETLADLADGGTLGEVRGLRSSRLGWGPFHTGVDSVYSLLPHDLSIVFAVLRAIPPVVSARGVRYPGDADGWCDFSVLFAARGPHVVVEASTVSAVRVRRVEVVGTLGSAVLPDTEAPAVEVMRHDGDVAATPRTERLQLAREWPLLRELRDFVGYCRGGPAPRADAAEGFAVVRSVADVRTALAAQADSQASETGGR